MLTQTKVWIRAARVRTLPLSVSGIIVGNALCVSNKEFSWMLFVLMLITAMSFQIISNFANDYGDGVKGTDNDQRIGPERVLQAGLLSRKTLKTGILISSSIALILATVLIIFAFGKDFWVYVLIFFGLSIVSIWSAISYTVGTGAYGYQGLGDLFVLLFFGGLSVLGSYFIQLKTLHATAFLLALVIGLLSVGVLNLNNMRDLENDEAVGKRTFAVLLGTNNAKFYHVLLIGIAILLLLKVFYFSALQYFWLPILIVFPLSFHLWVVIKNKLPKNLDPELKKVSLSTFLLSWLIFITLYLG
ncbi:MAG: 1,4-dihydroxy-2-naphthoate octaprenyltransferase [Flavobacteriaceae bacterium]